MVAGIVMSFQGYGRWSRSIFGLMAVAVASILLMQPLSEETHKLQIKSKVLRLTKTLLVTHPHIFKDATHINTLRIRYQDDLLYIHAEGQIAKDHVQGAQERLDQLRLILEEKIGEPLIVTFEVIPVDILSFQSPPEVEATAGAPLPENQIE